MAETTGIAWTTSSWNPWVGCTEVSPGCDNCYARELDRRYQWGGGTHWGAGKPRHRTQNWRGPLAWNKKAAATGQRWTVFPSLCDPFDNEVPEAWRADLFQLIAATPNLTWLLLTKRIGNAAKMITGARPADDGRGAWPWPNVWLGASVVNQEEADRDIPKLLATPAAKRFVSYEPALGPVDFTHIRERHGPDTLVLRSRDLRDPHINALEGFNHNGVQTKLDWLIVGGESSQGGAKARPFDLAWARSTVSQCKASGVPVFVKQLGSAIAVRNDSGDEWPDHDKFDDAIPNDYQPQYQGEYVEIRLKDRAGADPAEWPEDLRVQEFPGG